MGKFEFGEWGSFREESEKFCYLGDMLNGEGGSRLASISRVDVAGKV